MLLLLHQISSYKILSILLLLSSYRLHSIESHVIQNQNNDQLLQNIYHYNKPEINTILTTNSIEDMQTYREKLSKKMLSLIDKTADPCNDFYEYACGNWDKQIELEDDNNVYDPSSNFFIGLKDDMLERLTYILTSTEFKKNYQKNKLYNGLLNAREYYKTCMKENIFDVKPIPEYLEFVKKNIGFPAINRNWKKNNFDISNATGYCNIVDNNCLFKIKIAEIYPFCPILAPLETFGLNNGIKLEDFTNEYSIELELNKDVMKYFLKLYGVEERKSIKIVDDIMKFGYKLLNYSSQGNNSDMEVKYLYEIQADDNDAFDWLNYYEAVLDTNDLDPNFIIAFRNREFFHNFSVDFFNFDNFDTISNYLSLNVLYQLHIENRWNGKHQSYCLSKTKIDYSFLIASIYHDLYTNVTETNNLMHIFNSLRQAQVQVIQNSNLYAEKTKATTIKKIQNLKVYMGYIDDPIIIELIKLIENFNITENYYKNNLNSFLLRNKIKYYHSVNNVTNTTQPLGVLNPLIINASYYRNKNSIQLNAAGLRPPLYDSRFPKSLIYGGTGQMMAHEISHVFDADSSKILENYDMIVPWIDTDLQLYENRTECFVKQYNKKYFPEINLSINGTKTLCENIADNGGLLLTYKAYINAVNRMTYNQLMQEILPNTEWNHLQTFFIAHAQKYCTTYFRKCYLDESDTPYSFANLRANVPLENLPEFGKAFNCPIGSKMNPVEKCSIF